MGRGRGRRRAAAPRPPRPWRDSLAARLPLVVLALGALAALAIVVPRGSGFTSTRFATVAAAAWLPSYRVGEVALVDGTTADTLAHVDVVDRETRLDVVQSGTNALVLDRDRGRLTRVDGGTLLPTSASPFGTSSSLQPFAGPGAVYVYDRVRGALAILDPVTLEVRRRLALAKAANEYASGVDAGGDLWVIAQDSATVNAYGPDGRQLSRTPVGDPSSSHLEIVKGRPVVLDQSRKAAVRPVLAGGVLGPPTCLPGVGHRLWSEGSHRHDRVYFSDGEVGTLMVSDLAARTCDRSVEVAPPGHLLGPPVEVGEAVLVADWTTSTVTIVDTTTWQVRTVGLSVPRRATFDLIAGAGFAYYNDPRSEHAGVITLTGYVAPSRKYNPEERVLSPNGFLRRTTSPSPSVTPSTTPTTTSPSRFTSTPPRRPTPPPSTSPTSTSPTPTPSATTSAPTPTPSREIQAARLQIAYDPPPAPEIGKTYRFQLLVSGPRQPTEVTWRFGDNATSSGVRTQHAFTAAGEYTVVATAIFADGSSASTSSTFTVHPEPVVLPRQITPQEVLEDVPTRFSATYENGTPRTYAWKVHSPSPGSRVIATSTEAEPTFTFPEPTPDAGAPYRVSLQVDGKEQTSVTVVVGPARPSSVAVSCSPSRPLVGQRVTCSASANGYVTSWEWRTTDPDGRPDSATTTSGSLSLPPAPEGTTTVAVVAINRNGRSATAGHAVVTAATTTLGDVTCSPSPATAGDKLSCSVSATGWSSRFTDVTWSLAGTTERHSGTIATTCGGRCTLSFSTSVADAGRYRLTVGYRTPAGDPRSLDGGSLTVNENVHTLTVVSLVGGRITTEGKACDGGRTCVWTYPAGTQVALTMEIVDDRYTLSGWTPDCTVPRQTSVCAVTLDRDITVTPNLGIPLLLTVTLTAPGYCTGAAGEDPATCKPRNGTLTVTVGRGSGSGSQCSLPEGHSSVTCSYASPDPQDFDLSTDEPDGADFTGCSSSSTRTCSVRLTRQNQDVGVAFR